MPWDIFAANVFIFILTLGFLGCVLPYPGPFVILGGCAFYSYSIEQYPAWYIWVILVILTCCGYIADSACSMLGAKKFGGGKAAVFGALIGLIIGAFFFPFGLIIGAFTGAFIGELIVAGKNIGTSAGAGLGALLGYILGVIIKFIVALIVVGIYLISLPTLNS